MPHACFLQRKNWDGNISFSVQKMLEKIQKCQKITIFGHFRPFSGVLKLLKQQIFSRCSTPCLFSSEKNLRWYYFIISAKNVQKNPKMSSAASSTHEKTSFFSVFNSVYSKYETRSHMLCVIFINITLTVSVSSHPNGAGQYSMKKTD